MAIDKYAELRAALTSVAPCGAWSKSRSVIGIAETEDWPAIRIRVHANNLVGPKVAGYLKAVRPDAIRVLLEEREALREAIDTIAAYPFAHDQTMRAEAMRKIACDALAQMDGGNNANTNLR